MSSDSKEHGRRLAAILYADIVGFSALMGADEDEAHAATSAAMARCRDIVASHHGRVVNTAGDAFLAEFPSIVDAVSAAVDLQATAPAGATDIRDKSVRFRVGINIGDVIIDGDDIFGDGVNVAARIQELAPPGGIAVTRAARTQLGNRLDIAFQDLGQQMLKNIATPVRVFIAEPPFDKNGSHQTARVPARAAVRRKPVVVALGFVLGLLLFALGGTFVAQFVFREPLAVVEATFADARPVLAVLPFDELGPAAEDTYYADGFTEDIITHLGRFSELVVLSWNAVAPYRGHLPEIEKVRRELNARYVIGGSIRRQSNAIRLTVQLTDARDGTLLWSEQFQDAADDIFELQDTIAGTVAGALALGVEDVEQRSALKKPTDRLDAYDLVLRGRFELRKVDRANNLKARDLFRRALDLDPNYADARAGLAWTYVNDLWWGWNEWPEHSMESGEQLAREALDIDPNNVLALNALSELAWMKKDFQAARDFCRGAVRRNPNDPRAHASCAGTLIFSGAIEEGIRHGELTMRLDPEGSSWRNTTLAIGYYFQERYADAAQLLSRSAHFLDEDPAPHAVLAAIYSRMGRPEAAREEVERTLRLFPFFDAEIFAGNLAVTGYSDELLAGLREAGFE